MVIKIILIMGLIAGGTAKTIEHHEPLYGHSEVISEPVQIPVENEQPIQWPLSRGEAEILPIASYSVSGIVVGTKRYDSGWESEVAPIDIAIIWGELTTPEVRRYMKYSQRTRWVYYEWKSGCPVKPEYIESHVSNNHCIPANDRIEKALFKIQKEDEVTLEGMLVKIDGKWDDTTVYWHSSTTRTDTGDGACEVMFVKRVTINGTVFE